MPLALVVAVAVGACRQAPSGPPVDPSRVDPCELVTSAEVEDAVGRSLGDPIPEEAGGEARDCGFGTKLAPRVNVGIRRTPITEEAFGPFVDRFAGTVPGAPEVREVDDLGEDATAIVLAAGAETDISHVTLFVRERSVLLSVGLNLEASGERTLEAATALAAAALGRL